LTNQAYVKEQMNWYITMRPYKVANVDPYVFKPNRPCGRVRHGSLGCL
jgi:hypothetical protein